MNIEKWEHRPNKYICNQCKSIFFCEVKPREPNGIPEYCPYCDDNDICEILPQDKLDKIMQIRKIIKDLVHSEDFSLTSSQKRRLLEQERELAKMIMEE